MGLGLTLSSQIAQADVRVVSGNGSAYCPSGYVATGCQSLGSHYIGSYENGTSYSYSDIGFALPNTTINPTACIGKTVTKDGYDYIDSTTVTAICAKVCN